MQFHDAFYPRKITVCMYVFILQQDNTQNIKPEGQQGSKALTAARNKKCLEQILATTIRIRTEAY